MHELFQIFAYQCRSRPPPFLYICGRPVYLEELQHAALPHARTHTRYKYSLDEVDGTRTNLECE